MIVGDEEPSGRRGEQVDTVDGEPVEQVEDVEVVDQRVVEPDEGVQQRGLPVIPRGGHHRSPSNRSLRATTSRATASIGMSWTNACARRVASAASGGRSSCAMTIPVAW